MTLISKNFSEVITFSRGTGATRVNSAGLIVGVDFSTTSNTIATGSKTFTLAADANVNRDWPVGSNVIAVAQAGATGSMTGTVTSYTPSTQSLVINVVSVTGSGTSTDWRIGSLEMREDYDPVTLVRKGVLSEVAATNFIVRSNEFDNAVWAKGSGLPTVLPNTSLGLDGSVNADKLIEGTTSGRQLLRYLLHPIAANNYSFQFYAKAAERTFVGVSLRDFAQAANIPDSWFGVVDLSTGAVTQPTAFSDMAVSSQFVGNGWYKVTAYGALSNAANDSAAYISIFNGGTQIYEGNGTSGILLFGAQVSQSIGSYIPTTSAQVTRNADSFPLTAAAVASIRQGESTLYAEIDCPDTGVAQKRALRLSGVNADIRIGKQGTGTLSNFTKMAEGAGLRLMGTANSLIRGNGQDLVGVTAVNDRNGVASAVGVTNAIAFDGVNRFALGSGAEEVFIDGLLGTFSGKGAGGIEVRAAHHNGNRFLMTANQPGVVFVSDGISYRRVNTPVITQSTFEITSGLVGGTLRNVIVGSTGFIATSDDNGETWTARTSGTGGNLNGASFGSVGGTNYYIAVGNGTVRYSTDAITWLSATGTTGNLIDIHIANNIAVAVNSVGLIFTSTNGTSFTQATNSNTTNVLAGVTYAASLNLWVACGSGGTIVTASNPSGTWTLRSSGALANLNEVGIFNNAIYVVGDNQTLLTSTNGTSYTSLTAGVSGNLVGIAASSTTLVITGGGGSMASSTDGTTFTSRTCNGVGLNGIAFGNNVFVSVGSVANGSGYIATIAADGTVTRRVSGASQNITNVRFLNGAFYATRANAVQRATDPNAGFTSVSIPNIDTCFDIAFGDGIFVAINNGGASNFSTSLDGLTFSNPTAFNIANSPLGVDFANGVFVVVFSTGDISTGVRSGNTVVFTKRVSGVTTMLRSVMFSQRDQLWYAAGNGGVLLYSPDAVTWTAVQNSGTASILGTTLQSNQPLPQFKNGVNKIALSYKANQVISALNGVASTTDTTATIPSITAGTIGENFNGTIQKIEVLDSALTTSEIIEKTL